MATSDDEKKPLVANVPENFPYVRAWIVSATGIVLYMLCGISIVPVVAQYVVKRLTDEHSHSNFANVSVVNASNPCNTTVTGPVQQQIQNEASDIVLYYSLVSSGSAICINLFLGPVSDFVGRKFLFVFPLLGICIKSAIICFIVYYNLKLDYLYIAFGVDGLFGSYYAILVATFSYTADVTVPGNARTVGIAIMEGSLAVSAAFGQLVAGYLIKSTGFFYPILVFAILALLDLVIVCLFLPETKKSSKPEKASPLRYIKSVVGFYFTEGTCFKRCVYWLLMSTFFFSVIQILGRSTLETIYQLGEPFCWDSVHIGFFGAIRLAVQFTCSVLALKLLQKYCSDEIISIISCSSALASFILEAFATNGLMMYFVPVAGILGAAQVPVARALMSKMTSSSKQGALFASIAIIETICNSASTVLYNLVYTATVVYFRGAVWLMMVGICVINICLLLTYRCVSSGNLHKLQPKQATEIIINANDREPRDRYGSNGKPESF